jgi:uncharacterized membrane protein YhaH (DUF805 family)
MIGAVLKQIFGLFIDDPILAIGIFAIVCIAALIALTAWTSAWAPGLVLVIGLPAILIADVAITAGRSTDKQTS